MKSERVRRLVKWALPLLLILLLGALALFFRAGRILSLRLTPEFRDQNRNYSLSFRPFTALKSSSAIWGDASVSALAPHEENLVFAGGNGLGILSHATADPRMLGPHDGFPSLRVSAAASWRSDLVFAFEAGGWGRLTGTHLEEASTSAGPLQVRTFLETEAGELLIGAKQGLFRSSFGSQQLEVLSRHPVRALALVPGGEILLGGEKGLWLVNPAESVPREVNSPDPWIDAVGVAAGTIWASTARGIARGPLNTDSPHLDLHPQANTLSSGVVWESGWITPREPGKPGVVALFRDGKVREFSTPEPFQKLFAAGSTLFASGASGIFRRQPGEGWELIARQPPRTLPHPHVNAIGALENSLLLGFFDGGLIKLDPKSGRISQFNGPWGVNAILNAGGAAYAATLRGAFRIQGTSAEPIEGAGAAFSAALTSSGVAIGYGQGVLLPGRGLLSAFHGLPGNQAYALASSSVPSRLWVGTPTGLGRIDNQKVTLRVARGEGKLPHPWVTALAETSSGLFIATYGGGVARLSDTGTSQQWETFTETGGLRINAGALLIDGEGRIIIGTQGQGLWASEASPVHFRRLRIPLPSQNVFSLALYPFEQPDVLLAGTDEGLLQLPLSEFAALLRETP